MKAQIIGKESQRKGKKYEKFVAEVYNWLNDVLVPGKQEYKIKKNKDKKTGEVDIYFEYKLPNGVNKTLIECKSGQFEKKDMFAFIGKLSSKGGNMHGIFAYNNSQFLTEGIRELAENNNIELKHLPMENGFIDLTQHSYRQYSLLIKIDKQDGQIKPFYKISPLPFDKDGKYYVIHDSSLIEKWFEENKEKAVVVEIPKELSDKFLFENLQAEQKRDITVDCNGYAKTKIITVGLINNDVKFDGRYFNVDKKEFQFTVFVEYIATYEKGQIGLIIGDSIISPLRKPIKLF